jgi:cold shock CspA family protein
MLKGKVLYWRPNDDGIRGFGFITPLGCNGIVDRERNVWFGPRQLDGASVEGGDLVSYELDDAKRRHKGPRAKTVRVLHEKTTHRDEAITTHHGADEYI